MTTLMQATPHAGMSDREREIFEEASENAEFNGRHAALMI